MNNFSLFNYNNLSDSLKADFNESLARRLSSSLMEIKKDDVLGSIGVEDFVASTDVCPRNSTLLTDLYSKVSSGIQAGSGNQNLFHAVLGSFTESWNQINTK